MQRIGVLYGMENTFPPTLVERINNKKIPGVTAEAIRIGCVKAADPSGYAVLIDRISHDVEFYRAFLKNAALTGTIVLNDPVRAGTFDRFYICGMAARAGLAVPRSAILPQKEHPTGTTVLSMRNLLFPLDWEEIFAYVGFPANLKSIKPRRWVGVTRVNSPEEFFAAYDQTGSSATMLQQAIDSDDRYRCYVVGDKTRVIPFQPENAHGKRYRPHTDAAGALTSQISRDAHALCRGLGLDIGMVEFALQDGTPYMSDLTHTAPEADPHAIGSENFEWLVESVAQLAIRKATGEAQKEASRENRQLAASV
jgi:glutathione synthase/RimK-type ligase-like ATP-grasp enzyme